MLLESALTGVLRCPSCAGGDWREAPTDDAPSWGAIVCTQCGSLYLVADGVPVLLQSIDCESGSRAELLRASRAVLGQALGRFAELLGGVEEALDHCERAPLDRAFEVPGATWLSLKRFSTKKFGRVPALVPAANTLLDLGCGFGASAVPFLVSGRASKVIGVDENLLFLLLFRRYCRERSLPVPHAACFDLGRFPYPFADGVADTAIAISFFNHFASLRPAALVASLFRELGRLVRPAGAVVLDMVPNRLDPFTRELNLADVISSPKLRRRVAKLARGLPLKWLPSAVAVPGAWAAYRTYAGLTAGPAPGLAEFRKLIPKSVPELALGGLPLDHRAYRRLLADFEGVEILEEGPFYSSGELTPAGRFSRTPYFILRGTRAGSPAQPSTRGACELE